jgi:hypothetical protein
VELFVEFLLDLEKGGKYPDLSSKCNEARHLKKKRELEKYGNWI